MRYLILLPILLLLNSCINTKNAEIKTGIYVTNKPSLFKVNYEYHINDNYMSYNDTLKILNNNKYELNLRYIITYGTYNIKSDSLILESDSTFLVHSKEMFYKKDKTSPKNEILFIKNDEKIIRNSTFRFCDDTSIVNKEIFIFEYVKPI